MFTAVSRKWFFLCSFRYRISQTFLKVVGWKICTISYEGMPAWVMRVPRVEALFEVAFLILPHLARKPPILSSICQVWFILKLQNFMVIVVKLVVFQVVLITFSICCVSLFGFSIETSEHFHEAGFDAYCCGFGESSNPTLQDQNFYYICVHLKLLKVLMYQGRFSFWHMQNVCFCFVVFLRLAHMLSVRGVSKKSCTYTSDWWMGGLYERFLPHA